MRKRQAERDSETLSVLLGSVRGCILRVREDCHALFASSAAAVGGGTEEQCTPSLADAAARDEGSKRLQDSAVHFMRCCLHMYNVVEQGLNYLEDPGTNLQDVERAMQDAELLNVMVHTAPSSDNNSNGIVMLMEPTRLLVSMLHVMREEMMGSLSLQAGGALVADWSSKRRVGGGC